MKLTFFVVHFWDGGGSEKAYRLYTCENVDNCEQSLKESIILNDKDRHVHHCVVTGYR